MGARPAAHVGPRPLSVPILADLESRRRGGTCHSLWASSAGTELQASLASLSRTGFETFHKSSLFRGWELRPQLVD